MFCALKWKMLLCNKFLPRVCVCAWVFVFIAAFLLLQNLLLLHLVTLTIAHRQQCCLCCYCYCYHISCGHRAGALAHALIVLACIKTITWTWIQIYVLCTRMINCYMHFILKWSSFWFVTIKLNVCLYMFANKHAIFVCVHFSAEIEIAIPTLDFF